MRHSFSARRAAFLSFLGTCAVNILKFHPASKAKMDAIEAFVARGFGIPSKYDWVAFVVLFVFTSLVLYAVIKSRIGVWVYNRIAGVVRVGLGRFGMRRSIFESEERTSREFRADVLYSAKHSKKLHCLLVSAYTIVHEEEKFMLGDWLKAMDFKVLILDRESAHWEARGNQFLEWRLRADAGVKDLDHYKSQCEIAEEGLMSKYHADVRRHDEAPVWRLYIFDDRLYASRYSGPTEANFVEAKNSPVVAFSSAHPMYHWLYAEFRRLAPEEWKKALSKSLAQNSGP